jgi:hypothetical protein
VFEVLPARLRIIIVAGALPVCVFFALLAYGALSNLWADYKDSSDTTYLFVGGFALCVAVPFAALISLVLRGADNETRFYSVTLGVLLTVAWVIFLFAFASGPPDFGEGEPSAQPTPLGTPLATPAIATPAPSR